MISFHYPKYFTSKDLKNTNIIKFARRIKTLKLPQLQQGFVKYKLKLKVLLQNGVVIVPRVIVVHGTVSYLRKGLVNKKC